MLLPLDPIGLIGAGTPRKSEVAVRAGERDQTERIRRKNRVEQIRQTMAAQRHTLLGGCLRGIGVGAGRGCASRDPDIGYGLGQAESLLGPIHRVGNSATVGL